MGTAGHPNVYDEEGYEMTARTFGASGFGAAGKEGAVGGQADAVCRALW